VAEVEEKLGPRKPKISASRSNCFLCLATWTSQRWATEVEDGSGPRTGGILLSTLSILRNCRMLALRSNYRLSLAVWTSQRRTRAAAEVPGARKWRDTLPMIGEKEGAGPLSNYRLYLTVWMLQRITGSSGSRGSSGRGAWTTETTRDRRFHGIERENDEEKKDTGLLPEISSSLGHLDVAMKV